jgi:hypothetical protein
MEPEGETGYGYAWRHHHENVFLDVWAHDDSPTENECLDIESVEAEVVFLIRSAGQWPKDQTEIHFHPSTDVHRAAARSIMARYGALAKPTHSPSITVKRRTEPPVFLRARG